MRSSVRWKESRLPSRDSIRLHWGSFCDVCLFSSPFSLAFSFSPFSLAFSFSPFSLAFSFSPFSLAFSFSSPFSFSFTLSLTSSLTLSLNTGVVTCSAVTCGSNHTPPRYDTSWYSNSGCDKYSASTACFPAVERPASKSRNTSGSDGASVCSARTSPSTDVFAGAAASSRLPCVTTTTDGGAAEARHNASSARATGYSSLQ